jgi:hypothetical protein
MVVLFAGLIPKDPAYPEANEDVLVAEPTVGLLALSDGASESFDSKTWARLLAMKYAIQPEISTDWLSEAASEYVGSFDVSALSWSKQAAFDRGSFATLLGVQHLDGHNAIKVFAIGDTLAVFCDGTDLIDTFPYAHSEQFQEHPELFSTNSALNSCFEGPDFAARHHRIWSTDHRREPMLLCMTDALAEWALRSSEVGNPVWDRLIAINELCDLEALVNQERQTKNMRVDDTTLVRLSFLGSSRDELPNP